MQNESGKTGAPGDLEPDLQLACGVAPGIMLGVQADLQSRQRRKTGKTNMTTVPAGQRLWKCPDCGKEFPLSITQLDPIACDQCLAKLKGGAGRGRTGNSAMSGQTGGDGKIFALLPLIAVGGGMLLVGLLAGFVAGRASVPPPPIVRPTRPAEETAESQPKEPAVIHEGDIPDEWTRPGPGYKWVRGYQRKDGTQVKGYWAKDSKYVEPQKERRK